MDVVGEWDGSPVKEFFFLSCCYRAQLSFCLTGKGLHLMQRQSHSATACSGWTRQSD